MSRTDAELVVAFRRGDRHAFAEIYDRYADRLHTFGYARLRDRRAAGDALEDTFIRASVQLTQLRDPDQLRPWIFAIARNAVTDRLRDRAKQGVPDDLADLLSDDPDLAAAIEAEDTARLVWTAAAGVRDRDQELLEIHLREGLEGPDLALAMGVKPAHVYVMVGRMKRRLEIAVGSLLVARRGRDDCTDLDRILSEWDGRYSFSIRSNVSRHIESCNVCTDTRRAAIPWETVASALPSTSASPDSRTVVLAAAGLAPVTAGSVDGAGSGGPGPGSSGRRSPDRLERKDEAPPVETAAAPGGRMRALARRIDAGVIIAAAAVVGAGIALLLSVDRGSDAAENTDVTTIDQTSTTTVTVPVADEGSVDSIPPSTAPPTTVEPTPPTVPPTTVDQTPAILVDIPSFSIRPAVSSVAIRVGTIHEGTSACLASTLLTSTPLFVTATDHSGVASVEATWAEGTVSLVSSDSTTFTAFIGPWSEAVDDVVIVTATDTDGNTATASLTVVVESCPL